MQITKEFLQEKKACLESFPRWEQFNQEGNLDAIYILETLIEEKKLFWANWLIIKIMETYKNNYKMYALYGIFAAESVIDIYERKYPNDKRPRNAIEAAKKCITNPNEENEVAAYATHIIAYTTANIAYAAVYTAYIIAHTTANIAADKLKIKILQYGIELLKKEISDNAIL